ncbi:MAG: 3-ketoacyl-ACP reductase [Gemmataceae bacterium]|nr:3-ketoacyl-ACP reductase [Gemmataceae bacterium]
MSDQPVALVTGGSRGIGRGICVELARSGFAVCINYHGNEPAARETLRLCAEVANPDGRGSDICQGDVGQAADRERLVQTALGRWQRLDVLVNNAGITSVGRLDILEATEESWDQVLAVNLKGAFFLTQRVAQAMMRLAQSPPPSYQPAIVNISSVSAYALSTNRGDYCISKAGLSLATELWALRLAEHGIRVYEVRPGIIETDMTAAAKEKYDQLLAEGLTPIRRWGTPQDVGKAVAALVLGAIPFSTGEVINVDGGYHLRPFPR